MKNMAILVGFTLTFDQLSRSKSPYLYPFFLFEFGRAKGKSLVLPSQIFVITVMWQNVIGEKKIVSLCISNN